MIFLDKSKKVNITFSSYNPNIIPISISRCESNKKNELELTHLNTWNTSKINLTDESKSDIPECSSQDGAPTRIVSRYDCDPLARTFDTISTLDGFDVHSNIGDVMKYKSISINDDTSSILKKISKKTNKRYKKKHEILESFLALEEEKVKYFEKSIFLNNQTSENRLNIDNYGIPSPYISLNSKMTNLSKGSGIKYSESKNSTWSHEISVNSKLDLSTMSYSNHGDKVFKPQRQIDDFLIKTKSVQTGQINSQQITCKSTNRETDYNLLLTRGNNDTDVFLLNKTMNLERNSNYTKNSIPLKKVTVVNQIRQKNISRTYSDMFKIEGENISEATSTLNSYISERMKPNILYKSNSSSASNTKVNSSANIRLSTKWSDSIKKNHNYKNRLPQSFMAINDIKYCSKNYDNNYDNNYSEKNKHIISFVDKADTCEDFKTTFNILSSTQRYIPRKKSKNYLKKSFNGSYLKDDLSIYGKNNYRTKKNLINSKVITQLEISNSDYTQYNQESSKKSFSNCFYKGVVRSIPTKETEDLRLQKLYKINNETNLSHCNYKNTGVIYKAKEKYDKSSHNDQENKNVTMKTYIKPTGQLFEQVKDISRIIKEKKNASPNKKINNINILVNNNRYNNKQEKTTIESSLMVNEKCYKPFNKLHNQTGRVNSLNNSSYNIRQPTSNQINFQSDSLDPIQSPISKSIDFWNHISYGKEYVFSDRSTITKNHCDKFIHSNFESNILKNIAKQNSYCSKTSNSYYFCRDNYISKPEIYYTVNSKDFYINNPSNSKSLYMNKSYSPSYVTSWYCNRNLKV